MTEKNNGDNNAKTKGIAKTGKQELIEIYSNLLPPLKKQILNIARIVEDTQETLIDECKGLEIKGVKEMK